MEQLQKISIAENICISSDTLLKAGVFVNIIKWLYARMRDDSVTAMACQYVISKLCENNMRGELGHLFDRTAYYNWKNGKDDDAEPILVDLIHTSWKQADYNCGDSYFDNQLAELNELYEELFDLMTQICHEDYYFGAHWGNDSDFGFWEEEPNADCPCCSEDDIEVPDVNLAGKKVSPFPITLEMNKEELADAIRNSPPFVPQQTHLAGTVGDLHTSNDMGNLFVRETLLNHRDVKNPGGFMRSFIDAYLKADGDNMILLKPVAIALIKKYKMGC